METEDEKLLRELEEKEATLLAREEKLREKEPFYFYEPTTGDISEERIAFLREYIKNEDLPNRYYGSLDVLRDNTPIKEVLGGNRSGKTTTAVVNAIMRITGEIPRSLRGKFPKERVPTKWPVYRRHYGRTSKQIQEVLEPTYKFWLPRKFWHKQGWERTYNKMEKVLRLYKNGDEFIGHVSFWTSQMDVADAQGATVHGIDFDETPTKAHFDEAIMRMTTGKQLEINLWNTPTEGWGYIASRLKELAKDPTTGVKAWEICTVTNPYVNLKNLKMALQNLTYEEKIVRLLGRPVSLAGQIYTGECAVRDNIHFIKPFDLEWNNYYILRGLDPHPSKEAHCLEIAIGRNGKLYIVGAYKKTADTDQVKKDLAQRVVDRKYRLGWTAYDSSWDYEAKGYKNINIIEEYRKNPNPIPSMRPSEKKKGCVAAGVNDIKKLLKVSEITKEPGIYFFESPEVRAAVEHIRNLERDAARNEEKMGKRDEILEGPMDFHACLRMVVQQNPRFIEPFTDSYIEEPYEQERYV